MFRLVEYAAINSFGIFLKVSIGINVSLVRSEFFTLYSPVSGIEYLNRTIKKFSLNISNLFSGMVIALTSLVSTHFLCMGDYNIIIAGAVLPLLPGLAMTVAIRDTMRGDLVSGVARIAEALLSAACVAVDVGSILGLWLAIGGSLA